MEIIKNWASTLCVTVIFISIAYLLLHTDEMKKHVKFALSLILLSVMITPILNFLNFDETKIENPFKEKENFAQQNKDKESIYNNDYLKESLENVLTQKLKNTYKDKKFEVEIEGTMNVDKMEADIKQVNIGVIDDKKIKKVEKIVIGEKENKLQIEDEFLKEVKSMVCDELQISKDKINIKYM
ncbi:stage III sporulation protein AF [Clostridium tarantellae]|uniref:Stage III sporulation protein AF n=1 Tax=Clostridium tarantellae TaxID=39493 RepID=A0A6I1MPG5_9CLOT|nr:stage III sporulation protein AF [Clostridium tarantellae]MPQ42761.1 stage III sporulation protein AF [Clostridium tarantellae]